MKKVSYIILLSVFFFACNNSEEKEPKEEKKEISLAFKDKITTMEDPDGSLKICQEFILDDWLNALSNGLSYAKVMDQKA